MLSIYLSSVIICMIIMHAMLSMFKPAMKEKCWLSNETAKTNKLVGLFILSAVPIVRVAIIAFIFYTATHTKEEFEKWQAEVREKQNEGE